MAFLPRRSAPVPHVRRPPKMLVEEIVAGVDRPGILRFG